MSIETQLRTGGIAVWSIRHPVGVLMIALTIVVLGGFSLKQLGINLLPHLIYPEIRVRILDPGVPALIMEDQVTRLLEEQLAITEDAVSVQSRTTEGRSAVDLSFEYGQDINVALRDASNRLDRAKRFFPDTINAPVIYKLDPAQIPVLAFVISSTLKDPVELRSWVDDVFAKWFLTLPGVAATEVGGGLLREIQVLPDQQRLAGLGLQLDDIVNALKQGNVDTPGGRLIMPHREIGSRTIGRFTSVVDIANLPIPYKNGRKSDFIRLNEIAEIIDTHQDERLRVRLNGVPGIKLSIQKQPQANTVKVVDMVNARLAWLQTQNLVPEDIEIEPVGNQAVFVRHALNNATMAAYSGALLAMIVVYLFLGDIRRTLIIGSAIPIAILVTFVLMALGGLSLNIMTLGGLALGIGMLVDNTIVMLENIYRHQTLGESATDAPVTAAKEVNSAIVASTSTNLAAVLPFLFVGGLVGLLFRELIFTISAAIVASLLIALTLVPALSAQVGSIKTGFVRSRVDAMMVSLQSYYVRLVGVVLKIPLVTVLLFCIALGLTAPSFFSGQEEFLPKVDEGQIRISLTADTGVNINEMDKAVEIVEHVIGQQPDVESIFSIVGGNIYGRSQYEASNRSSINVQLVSVTNRDVSSDEWIERVNALIQKEVLTGVRVRMRAKGLRGVRVGRGDERINLRFQGVDLKILTGLADQVLKSLKELDAIRWSWHSAEEVRQELAINVDRERAAMFGLSVEEIGDALRFALQGDVVSRYIEDGRSYDIRLRLPQSDISNPQDIEEIILFNSSFNSSSPEFSTSSTDRSATGSSRAAFNNPSFVYLGDVASIKLIPTPATILRDQQRRIIELHATVKDGYTIAAVYTQLDEIIDKIELPSGYVIYDGGAGKALKEGRDLSTILLALALFLVFVVMAVQYESIRNPFVILVCVPFASIGVSLGINIVDIPLSMPVWLGLIMLAGIVVNNSIVLVEYIELERNRGIIINEAIINAARLRLRPILMTTLTTVVGMLPLAIGLGEGAEMLQPLAVTIVSGLSFSMVVSLLLVPIVYSLFSNKLFSNKQVI